MIKKILTNLLVAMALVMPGVALASSSVVYADDPSANTTTSVDSGSKKAACSAIGLTGGSCDDTAGKKVGSVVETIVNLLSAIVGIAAVIMIIISGFRYITSGGESAAVSGAKNTLIYAIVGLVIVALAQFIVRFVLNNV